MQETETRNGAAPVAAVVKNGQQVGSATVTTFGSECASKLVAALEEPFDPAEIKWRVTNTCKVGGSKGPRDRGQLLAYADPRAYTDRLNALFTPSGWTRDYNVQMVQNFERKERGATERTITAKIVVTSKVTIFGLGTHVGLGEEWADNDNAGTAAEAQAFKRACSCFGLGRYLYDLEGQWVDLDEKKRPLETPRLPDWACPKRQELAAHDGANSHRQASDGQQVGTNDAQATSKGGLYRNELLGQLKVLCGKVGFGLAKSVLQAVAKVDDPERIRDMAKMTAAFEKLEDISRGVERLRAAVAAAGEQRHAAVCRELNLASTSIDDIPDGTVLRGLVEALEGVGAMEGTLGAPLNGTVRDGSPSSEEMSIGEVRGWLLREANRVSEVTRRPLAQVINEAASGTFSFARLKDLDAQDAGNVRTALATLERMARA